MPRRNRNAHALTIDADKLADQASQLTAELGRLHGVTVYLADETQVYYAASAQGTGKSSGLFSYLAEWISQHPGCHVSFADAKAVTLNAR
jgi:hypothetical protein